MSLRCPECGAPAPVEVTPGRAYPCPRCRNPVLAVERAERAEPAGDPGPGVALAVPPTPPAAGGAPSTSATGFSLRWALLAFVVLGAAYVGAFELLTAEAKRDRARLVAAEPDVASFPDPGPAPDADDAKRRAWSDARRRYERRLDYERKGRWVDVMFGALGLAFLAQTALTVVIAVKARARSRQAARAEQRERERSAARAAAPTGPTRPSAASRG